MAVNNESAYDLQQLAATASKSEADAIRLFMACLLDCRSNGRRRPRQTDWSVVQCQLRCLLLKLPNRFTFNFLYICERTEKTGDSEEYIMNYSYSKGSRTFSPFLSAHQVNSTLEILLACGFFVKKVVTKGQVLQSTLILLRRLQAYEVPSLQGSCFAIIRSRLPIPVTDEVLSKTRLPKILYQDITREGLLTEIMDKIHESESLTRIAEYY